MMDDRKLINWCLDMILAGAKLSTAPSLDALGKTAKIAFSPDGPLGRNGRESTVQELYQAAVLDAFGAGLDAIGVTAIFSDHSPALTHSQRLRDSLQSWRSKDGTLRDTLRARVQLAVDAARTIDRHHGVSDVTNSPLYRALFHNIFLGTDAADSLKPGERFAFDSAASIRFVERLQSPKYGDAASQLQLEIDHARLGTLLALQRTFPERHVFGNASIEAVQQSSGIPPLSLERIYVPPHLSFVPNRMPRQMKPDHKVLLGLVETPMAALEYATASFPITVVEQVFGSGKSLTARAFTSHLLTAHDQGRYPRVPVYVTCEHGSADSLNSVLDAGVANSMRRCDIVDGVWVPSSAPYPSRVLWIIDGFDELGATPDQQRELWDSMHEFSKDSAHRFLVFSRPSALQKLDSLQSSSWGTRPILRLQIDPMTHQQRLDWIDRWSVAATDAAPPILVDRNWLREQCADDLYGTPILLLMLAVVSKSAGESPSKTGLYEHFMTRIATGKHDESIRMDVVHATMHGGLVKFREATEGVSLLPTPRIDSLNDVEQSGIDAFMFVLSHIAYDATARPGTGDTEVVSRKAIREVVQRYSDDVDGVLEMVDCAMLASHARSKTGVESFLFGHASLREFLAARYLVGRVYDASQNSRGRLADGNADVVMELGAIDLLDASAAAREFIADAEVWLSDLNDARLRKLRDWLVSEFRDPRQVYRKFEVASQVSNAPVVVGEGEHDIRRRVLHGLTPLVGCFNDTEPALDGLVRLIRISNAQGRSSASLVLRAASLEYASLDRADLTGADMCHVNLKRASLVNAHLDAANLRYAMLATSIANGASFRGARLYSALLTSAQLVSANFTGATVHRSRFDGCILTNAIFADATATRAKFSGADLRGASFVRSDLRRAEFTGARLNGVDFRGANLRGTTFEDATLVGARVAETWLPAKCFTWRQRRDISWVPVQPTPQDD